MDGGTATLGRVRSITLDDWPWLFSLAYKRYGTYDPGRVMANLADIMRSPNGLAIRSSRAFLVATCFLPPWGGQPECNILVLCAEEGAVWDAVRLARRSVEWATERGCRCWWFTSETGYDISAIAKRVGGVQALPRYRIVLAWDRAPTPTAKS